MISTAVAHRDAKQSDWCALGLLTKRCPDLAQRVSYTVYKDRVDSQLRTITPMSPLGERVQGILQAAVSENHGPVGLVYAAVDKDGNVLVEEAAGRRAMGSDAEVLWNRSFHNLR